MTTLLTIGFGDIHAAGQAARALVLVQMVFNVVIIATAATTINSRCGPRPRSARRSAGPRSPTGTLERTSRRQARRTQRNPT